MLQTTGTVYMSKTRPVVTTDAAGAGFTLDLVLVDNMGRNPHTGREEKEAYRVRWHGPDARAFWHAHGANLPPGTPLRVDLHRVRAAYSNTHPQAIELRARAKSIQIVPKSLHSNARQLSNAEQTA